MNISTEKWNMWDIVGIDGAFVVRVLNDIRKVFEKVERNQNPCVALDLTNTSYIDSSAITLLLNFQKRLGNAQGKLVIFGPSEDIQGIFSIVNLEESVNIFSSRSEFESTCQAG